MRAFIEIIVLAYLMDLKALFEWVKSLNIDWAGMCWAFAGSTIAMLQTKRRAWWEGLIMLVAGVVASMAFTPDVVARFSINQNAASFLIGLAGWGLAGFVIRFAKDPIRAYKQVRNINQNPFENVENDGN